MSPLRTVGYVRVSTDKQAERGISLEAQAEKIRAMALVQGAELSEIIVESGESAKSLNRPGMAKLLAMVEEGKVKAVIVAKLDRLTRIVKDLCELLERFERRGVALVSVAESLDTGSAAGRLVLNIMAAVSQWEREAIGERTRDAMRHKRSQGERVGNTRSVPVSRTTAGTWPAWPVPWRFTPVKRRSRLNCYANRGEQLSRCRRFSRNS
jgi:site-specific DNA recombinase